MKRIRVLQDVGSDSLEEVLARYMEFHWVPICLSRHPSPPYAFCVVLERPTDDVRDILEGDQDIEPTLEDLYEEANRSKTKQVRNTRTKKPVRSGGKRSRTSQKAE